MFINKWNSYGNNTGTGTQFANHYASLRPAQQALLKKAVDLIEGKLEFLEQFQNILSKVKIMNSQLEQQIQSKTIYAHNTGTGIQFAAYMSNILKIGLELKKEASVLLKSWDMDLIQELHQHGVTEKTIQILIDQNIRRSVLIHITDADLT